MNKIKREDIDNMILEISERIGDDTLLEFCNNLNAVRSALKEDGINDEDGYGSLCLSCIMTAQTNAIHTMREVLYKIFCGDETKNEQTKAEHETVAPMKQKAIDEIMKTLSSYNLSVSEAREILMASSKRLGNQKICM